MLASRVLVTEQSNKATLGAEWRVLVIVEDILQAGVELRKAPGIGTRRRGSWVPLEEAWVKECQGSDWRGALENAEQTSPCFCCTEGKTEV